MTAPRPNTDRTQQLPSTQSTLRTGSTPTTEGTPEPAKRLQLSPVQVAASALAAVSAAVVASFFGVAGTMIGTGLASVISTVSAALYNASLSTTNERLRRLRGRTGTLPAPATRTAPAAPGAAAEPASTQLLPQAVTHALPPPTDARPGLPPRLDPRRAPATRRPRWSRVAVSAVAVFVVAIGIITGIELIGQQPVSALVGGSSSTGTTTIGELAEAGSQSDTTPAKTTSPTTTAPATTGSSARTTSAARTTGTQDEEQDQGTASATATRSAEETTSASSANRSTAAPRSTRATDRAPASTTAPAAAASATP